MMRVYVEGVGLCGPGLEGWAASVPVLTGAQDYIPAPTTVPPSPLLPANERRRAVQTVKLALAVGAEAFAAAGRDSAEIPAIFSSSGGDGDTIDGIMSVLASSNSEISPTRFHNSVHNAPAGYWSIANASRAASSSLCCYDDSFAAGLLEAMVQATTEDGPVVLIAYDVCYPAPLSLVRPIGAAFAVALVLATKPTESAFASIELELLPASSATAVVSPALDVLRRNTPAARSLPLLAALATALTNTPADDVMLNYLDDMALRLTVTPAEFAKDPIYMAGRIQA